jgi:hypothetical protein
MVLKNPADDLGMAIIGGVEHNLPIIVSEVFPNSAVARASKVITPVFQLPAVLRIHEILERIRIRGSIPLTNGSGSGSASGSGPDIFFIYVQYRYVNNIFFP